MDRFRSCTPGKAGSDNWVMTIIPPRLADAVDQFVTGFLHLERAMRPVDDSAVPPVRHLHWPETGRRGERWTDEYFALDADPAAVIAAIRSTNPGPHHFLSDIYSSRGRARAMYQALGYHLTVFEPLMILDLSHPLKSPRHHVEDSVDLAVARRLTDAQIREHGSVRPTSQTQIDDPNILLEIINVGGEPVAGGKGVLLGDALYVSDISTLPSHRKQGLAASIMTALHATARDRGAHYAVLSATEMAASLYRTMGYQELAQIDFYSPAPVDPDHTPELPHGPRETHRA